jgi:putative toxin-antitoxin system antitoxin component (TIGR02293 family)
MSAILKALGGRKAMHGDPAGALEWSKSIHAGLPVAAALAFKEALHLTSEELGALLGVSSRTLARWEPRTSKLDAVSGDRLVRSARLFALAVEVLEDREAVARWLKAPQRALDFAIPLELAETDVGARAVEDLLGRMEHGVYT